MTPPPSARLRPAVAAFLLVSSVINLVLVLGFGDLYRRYFTLRYAQASSGGPTLAESVDGAMALLVTVTVAAAALYVALAALTMLRPRPLVLLTDLVVLVVAGLPTVVGRAIEVFSPTYSALPPVFGQTQLVLSAVAVALAAALLVSLASGRGRRVGPTLGGEQT